MTCPTCQKPMVGPFTADGRARKWYCPYGHQPIVKVPKKRAVS